MAGCSRTPLVNKLGIKPGDRIAVVNAPSHYEDLISPVPANVSIAKRATANHDMIHLFTRSKLELKKRLPTCLDRIRQNGTIWVSWPKKTSGLDIDISEDAIRRTALPLGLVDVKVCSVDETWSGLKLVVRGGKRTGHPTTRRGGRAECELTASSLVGGPLGSAVGRRAYRHSRPGRETVAFNEELDKRISEIAAGWPNTERKKMFGGICRLLNGNMVCGVYKDYLILRLGEGAAAAALKRPFVRPFDITGRPMKGWVMVEERGFQGRELASWLDQARDFVSSLPPK